MNQYVTGNIIKKLRTQAGMTQAELADKLSVSDKAVSKWETGRGYPDISLLEDLSSALKVSVIELLSGNSVINSNRHFNMKNISLYVCPVCSNIIVSTGETVASCCGIVLPGVEAEEEDDDHRLIITRIGNEYHAEISHPMEKDHYISFIIAVKFDGYEIIKLYPEGKTDAYFRVAGTTHFYYCCNRHGLFKKEIPG